MKQNQKSLSQITDDLQRSRRIRVVVSDMDGSFLNRQGRVSPANRQAVRRLQAAGLHFIVCTGRSYAEAAGPLREAGIRCDMIAMNGAAVYGAGGELKEEHLLSMDQVRDVFRTLKEQQDELIIQMVTDQGEFIVAEDTLFRHFFLTRIFPGENRSREEEDRLLSPYRRILPEEFFRMKLKCYKVVTLSEDVELIRRIREPLQQVRAVCVAASFPTNWEITHRNASKGEGLREYVRSLGLSLDQVMALGDGDNDRTMIALPLGWAVAMGNAGSGLQEAADVITESNEQDGFAAAAEALLAALEGGIGK